MARARCHGESVRLPRWVFALAVVTTMTACGTHAAPNGAGATGSASTRSSSSQAPLKATSSAAGDLSQVQAAGLPDDPQTGAALLSRLPSAVAGHARTGITPKTTTYSDGTEFSIAPLAEATPGLSMRAYFDWLLAGGEFTVTARSGAGEYPLWFVGESTDGRHHPSAVVGNADGHWLFGIDAVSDKALADLARALRADSSRSQISGQQPASDPAATTAGGPFKGITDATATGPAQVTTNAPGTRYAAVPVRVTRGTVTQDGSLILVWDSGRWRVFTVR